MSRRLNNQTILITGASSGIGKEAAYELAASGANLIICARRADKLEEVKKICKKMGAQKVLVFPLDLSNAADIDQLVEYITTQQIQIDVLINNAGFGHSEPFIEVDFQTVNELFQVNVFGLMYLTQQIALTMLEQPKGQIINVASLAGKVSTPNYTIYGATKGAIVSFSNALRMELKPLNIQVTVVNFGPVNTPFFDRIEGKRKEKGQNSIFTLTATQAGKILADAVGTSKREVNRPMLLNIGTKLYNFLPSLGDYMLIKYYNR